MRNAQLETVMSTLIAAHVLQDSIFNHLPMVQHEMQAALMVTLPKLTFAWRVTIHVLHVLGLQVTNALHAIAVIICNQHGVLIRTHVLSHAIMIHTRTMLIIPVLIVIPPATYAMDRTGMTVRCAPMRPSISCSLMEQVD